MVSTRIGHDQETGLSESSLNLIGEGSGSETTSEGGSARGRGELEYSSLKKNTIHMISLKKDKQTCGGLKN